MSPDKRELDTELAALEAELAELEGRKKTPKPAPVEKTRPAEAEPSAKRAFGFGRKKPAPASEPAPPSRAPEPPAPAPVDAPILLPRTDSAPWRQADGAWVRTVQREKPVVRRILDERDQVVREERADLREVEAVDAVKAERGVGRLFRRKKDG